MAAELDARYQEMTTQAAGDVARAELVAWRVAELRTSMDDLLARRDEALAQMELAKRRTSELRALSDDYKRSLTELQDGWSSCPTSRTSSPGAPRSPAEGRRLRRR